MMQINELYQEIIIDHGKNPRFFGKLASPTHTQFGQNPLCGDEMQIYVETQEDFFSKVAFEGKGCAICMASTSLMIEAINHQPTSVFFELFENFHALLTQGNVTKDLGKLEALRGVREFPIRIKCATLAWHTLRAALSKQSGKVTTE